jgi:hypothetical protein
MSSERVNLDVIDRAREATDCRQLADNFGVDITSRGSGDWYARCPVHDDSDPSFSITDDTFFCHGCGFTGDAIVLFNEVAGLRYDVDSNEGRLAAGAELADYQGLDPYVDDADELDPPERADSPEPERDRPDPEEIERRRSRARNTLHYCWKRLSWDLVAPLAYLQTRDIPEALARDAGVRPLAGNHWRRVLKDVGPERAVEAGIWNVNYSCAHPHSSVMAFAYWHRLEDGTVEFDTLRFREPRPGANVFSICSNSEVIPKGIAPTSPRSPYLAADAIPAARESRSPLYIVEGEIDALSLWRVGRYAVGAPGARSWRDDWTEQLQGLEHVIVLGDRDDNNRGEMFVRDVRSSVEDTLGVGWKRRHFIGRMFGSSNYDDSNEFLCSFGWQRLDTVLEDLEASLEGNKKAAV